MASYHLSIKPISRAHGRSSTGAAAYRAAALIRDERTGEVFDYRRRRGVAYTELVLPSDAPSWAQDRHVLWNAAESAEKRKNSTVGRDFEIALPAELNSRERKELAVRFAQELVDRHGMAVDVAIHTPHRQGNQRNQHAHLLASTRRLNAGGFHAKTRELDDLRTGPEEVTRWRKRWADLQNEALAERGHTQRVDHRTLEAQGIDREPTRHRGPAVTAMERRGVRTEVEYRLNETQRLEIQARLERAVELGRLEREAQYMTHSILELDTDVSAARRARTAHGNEQTAEQVRAEAKEAWARWRAEQELVRHKEPDRENENDLAPEPSRSLDGPDYEI